MKCHTLWLLNLILLSGLLISHTHTFAQSTNLTAELSQIWQSRNDQRVPGNSGTKFSIADFDNGPFTGYRIYFSYFLDERHEFRALYAPLEFEVDGQFKRDTYFQNTLFAANTKTTAFYKFNSYRLTYAYHFEPIDKFRFALGFTAKIRDAEVRLSQNELSRSKTNVGFVPLLNFQMRYEIFKPWTLRFDLDGLAAPQGRAFDAALFVEREFQTYQLFGGYRTIEGGADNDKVYNFAWIHQAVVGASLRF